MESLNNNKTKKCNTSSRNTSRAHWNLRHFSTSSCMPQATVHLDTLTYEPRERERERDLWSKMQLSTIHKLLNQTHSPKREWDLTNKKKSIVKTQFRLGWTLPCYPLPACWWANSEHLRRRGDTLTGFKPPQTKIYVLAFQSILSIPGNLFSGPS